LTRVDFVEIFPGANAEAIDFLVKALQFSPKRRMTVNEAIEHPLLVKVREKKKETIAKGIKIFLNNIKPRFYNFRF
jgi:mitogen-activated protein kinase 1/3